MNTTFTATPAKDPGQATFSAIGDMHVAVGNAMDRAATAKRRRRWAAVAGYPLLADFASLAALLGLDAPPRLNALLTVPIAPALVCLAAAWSRSSWKVRARNSQAAWKTAQKTLESLAHETASGVDAIRAHMIGLRTEMPEVASSPHFERIGRGADRIHAALRRLD